MNAEFVMKYWKIAKAILLYNGVETMPLHNFRENEESMDNIFIATIKFRPCTDYNSPKILLDYVKAETLENARDMLNIAWYRNADILRITPLNK